MSIFIKIITGFFAVLISISACFAQVKPVNDNPYRPIDKIALALPAADAGSVQNIAAYINQHFTNNADKVRAAFAWVTGTISYDIDNMFAINLYETKEDKLKKVLAAKKGICEHFALLFTAICNEMGIETYTINGFTKQNGFTDYIPHVWAAAAIDNNWYLFDPTWGSGYILNKKFVRKLNNNFYRVNPEKLIQTHLPFDYLWQFLNYPVTTAQFYENKTGLNKNQPYFSYADSIRAYNKADAVTQLQGSIYRIEKNGVRNAMIFDRLHYLKVQLENLKINEQNQKQQVAVDAFNKATDDYNTAIALINEYINYRNHQFVPEKPDAAIKEMYDTVARTIAGVQVQLATIDESEPNVAVAKSKLQKNISTLRPQLQEQKDWLNEYLSKPKSKRRAMFYERKLTWFGIPVK